MADSITHTKVAISKAALKDLKKQIEQQASEIATIRKQNEELTQELLGYKKFSDTAQQTIENLTHNTLLDVTSTKFEPKAKTYPPVARDICICHSTETGAKSASLIKQYLDKASTVTSSLLACPIMKENTVFDADAAEEMIASSSSFLLLMTDHSLKHATTIFAVKTALLYGIDIITVHDIGSCPFPTVMSEHPLYMESGIFNDKSITFLDEYLDKCGLQIVQKFKSENKARDLCLCFFEGTKEVRPFSACFDQFVTITMTLARDCNLFEEMKMSKILQKANSAVVYVTKEIVKCWKSFETLLRNAEKCSKRLNFAFSQDCEKLLKETFSAKMGRAILDENLDSIVLKYFSHLEVSRDIISPEPPIGEKHMEGFQVEANKLDIYCQKGFPSIIYSLGVNEGKWYYEVTLRSNGTFQIGWTFNLEFGGESGVGDDETSFAFDGSRVKKWNGGADEDYGHTWSVGDVVGMFLDLDAQEISFSLNGESMGVAFHDFCRNQRSLIVPGITCEKYQSCTVNLGNTPFADKTVLEKGFKPILQAPIHSAVMFAIPGTEYATATKLIVEREQLHGNCQQIEELTTHAFLSHKRSSAQGIAGRIFQELKTDYNVFLDSEATFNLHNLQLIVKHTGLFIFMLSDGIFDSYWCLEEFRAAIQFRRRILILRNFTFEMPSTWPTELHDIRDTIVKSDTIIYMAEFFSECVQKIKHYLGPIITYVGPVHQYLKMENTGVYKRILDNNFDSEASVTLHTGKKYPPISDIVSAFKYYYGCGSIVNLGRLVVIESTEESERMSDSDLILIANACPNLQILEIPQSRKITDEGICHLANTCKGLRELKLNQNQNITAKSLEAIALNCSNMAKLLIYWAPIPVDGYHPLFLNCHKLTRLCASYCYLTDQEMELIAANCPLLKELTVIRSEAVTDEGIKHLASGCHNLEILNLNENPNLTDLALKYLSEGCPRLKQLMCERSDKITDKGLEYLSNCTALTDVDLDFCTLFTDEGLKHVKNLHNLRSFCVDRCINFTDQGLKYLSEGCPLLMKLRQHNNFNITDIGIGFVSNGCHYLREIDVGQSKNVTDTGLKDIAKGCKDVQLLGLGSATKVTDVGLLALAETCHSLNFLNVRGGSAVTDVGAMAIAKGCPIRSFYANTVHMTEATVEALAQRPMQNIGIYGTNKMTSRSVQKLIDISPDLVSVTFENCPEITEINFEKCKNVETINLQCAKLTDAGVSTWLSSTNVVYSLTTLNLRDSKLTENSIIKIAEKFPRLRVLNIASSTIEEPGLLAISNLKHLWQLFITNSTITEKALSAVTDIPYLQILDADKAFLRLEDNWEQHFFKLKYLESLTLRSWNFSAQALDKLSQHPTLTTLYTSSALLYDQDKKTRYIPTYMLANLSEYAHDAMLEDIPTFLGWDYNEFIKLSHNQIFTEFSKKGVQVLCNNLCAIKYFQEANYTVNDPAALALTAIPLVETLRVGFHEDRKWDVMCSFHFTNFEWLNVISLDNCMVTNQDMECFAYMTELVEFDIGNANAVTDQGVVDFTNRVKNLKKLYLPSLKLGELGITAIAQNEPSLEELNIMATTLDDACVNALINGPIVNLKVLICVNADAYATKFKAKFPALEIFTE